MWIEGNLEIQITKILSGEAEKIGDLAEKGGNLLNEATDSPLDGLFQQKKILV